MERAGLTVADVVEMIGTSRPTMFKLLKGDHRPQKVMFTALLPVLNLSPEERAELLALYETADVETVEIAHEADLPKNYVRFRRDEADAEIERTLDPVVVPGLLQTDEYAEAHAVAAWRIISGESWNDKAAAERAERRNLLTRYRNPLKLSALIDIAALYRMVGSADVMNRQYDHLLDMGALPNVEVRVIPYEAGAYGVPNGALPGISVTPRTGLAQRWPSGSLHSTHLWSPRKAARST